MKLKFLGTGAAEAIAAIKALVEGIREDAALVDIHEPRLAEPDAGDYRLAGVAQRGREYPLVRAPHRRRLHRVERQGLVLHDRHRRKLPLDDRERASRREHSGEDRHCGQVLR